MTALDINTIVSDFAAADAQLCAHLQAAVRRDIATGKARMERIDAAIAKARGQ